MKYFILFCDNRPSSEEHSENLRKSVRNKNHERCTACRKFVKHAVTANATQNLDPGSLNINKKKSKSVPSLSSRECALSSELLYRAVIIHRGLSEERGHT